MPIWAPLDLSRPALFRAAQPPHVNLKPPRQLPLALQTLGKHAEKRPIHYSDAPDRSAVYPLPRKERTPLFRLCKQPVHREAPHVLPLFRLQAKGFRVTLFEKNDMVGGHAYQLKQGGYTFDMGPSLITAPDLIDRLFRAAGRQTADYLDLVYLDPFYRIYFHDGSVMDCTADAGRIKAQMARMRSSPTPTLRIPIWT